MSSKTTTSNASVCRCVVLMTALALGACAKEPGTNTDSATRAVGSGATSAPRADTNATGVHSRNDDAAAMHRSMSAADSTSAVAAGAGASDTTGHAMAGSGGGTQEADKGMSMMDDGMKMMGQGMHMMEQGKAMMAKQGMPKDSTAKGMTMMDDAMEMMDKGKDAMSKGKSMVKQKTMADPKMKDGHM